MYNPDINNQILLNQLEKEFNSLVKPLEHAVWELDAHPFPKAPSALWLITYELQMLLAGLLVNKEIISCKEAEFYFDFCWYFKIESDDLINQSFPLQMRIEALKNSIKENEIAIIRNCESLPAVIDALKFYDIQHKSHFFRTSKKTFFRFVSKFIQLSENNVEENINELEKLLQINKNEYKGESYYNSQKVNCKTSTIREKIRLAHEVLDIKIGASKKQILVAYKEQVKSYHPDKIIHFSPKLAKLAEEQMKEINLSYEILKAHNWS